MRESTFITIPSGETLLLGFVHDFERRFGRTPETTITRLRTLLSRWPGGLIVGSHDVDILQAIRLDRADSRYERPFCFGTDWLPADSRYERPFCFGRLRFTTRDVLVANSPSAIHELLVTKAKHFPKSPALRTALYPLAGDGLFTAEGEAWRRQRRMMSPVFHRAKIDGFADAMVACAEHASRRWQSGTQLDIARETTRIAMKVAGRTLFGMDTTDEADSIGHALTVALDWANYAVRAAPYPLQVELRLALLQGADRNRLLAKPLQAIAVRLDKPILWPTQRTREMQSAIALLDERVQRMIDERRADGSERDDLLSHLLRARDDDGAAMSDKQLRDEILTLFIAGHETTATGLAWSLYSLAREPRLYARARAAVDALDGRTPTPANLESLDFLSCVFNEALRMYPPVYIMARMSDAETSLAGHPIPKNAVVLVCYTRRFSDAPAAWRRADECSLARRATLAPTVHSVS